MLLHMAEPNSRSIRNPSDLEKRLAAAAACQPHGWSSSMALLREQYDGNVEGQMLAAASMRFPMTAHRMPRTPFNWAEVVADKGATIYDETPIRVVIGEDDNALDEEDDAAAAFADALKEARFSVVMPEADKVRALGKSVVLSIRSDSLEAMATGRKVPRTVLDMLWSNDVFVIPHPHAPTLLQAALEVFVRSSGSPDAVTYVHWMHDVEFDEQGRTTKMGKWSAELVTVRTTRKAKLWGGVTESKSVEVRTLWEPYPLPHLPLVVLNGGLPSGFPFTVGNSNLTTIFNTVNSGIMSEVYTGDMNAAPLLAHTTNVPQPSNVFVGPGIKVNLLKGETLESVTQTADLAGLRTTNEALLDNLSTTTHQPQGAYTGDEGAESGVALKVKNIPATRQRRKMKEITAPIEQEELLPIFVEVHDYFAGTSIAAKAKGYRVTFIDPPDFETPAEKQDRLAAAVDIGWIGKPRAATDAGYYKTEAEAEAAIVKLDEEKQGRMGALANVPPGDGSGDIPGDDVDLADPNAPDPAAPPAKGTPPVPPKPPAKPAPVK